ncbi:hypothetical protein BDZ97DRAFT_1820535 [Flammula alnicola]|nr:hypothetical protein BDZ97DRAFT_1820535 [Flammula alnicola]
MFKFQTRLKLQLQLVFFSTTSSLRLCTKAWLEELDLCGYPKCSTSSRMFGSMEIRGGRVSNQDKAETEPMQGYKLWDAKGSTGSWLGFGVMIVLYSFTLVHV